MTDLPKMMYGEEAMNSLIEGSDLMAQMVRDSLYTQHTMPPKPVFDWYVHNVTYRLVVEEYRMIYSPDDNSLENVKALSAEFEVLRDLLAQNKQFGLQSEIDQIMKTRMLHLPEGYIAQGK